MDIDSIDAAMEQDPSVFDVSHISDKLLIEESGKLVFMIGLLENLRAEKHRCLVFSSSRRMLDIVEKVMGNKVSKLVFNITFQHSYMAISGTKGRVESYIYPV